MSFSKILMLFIISSFFISIFFFCIVWVKIDRFPSDLFNYIATPFLAILPSYMAKAVVENRALSSIELAGVVDTISGVKDLGGSISEDLLQNLFDILDKKEHNKLSRTPIDEVEGNGSGISEEESDCEEESEGAVG